MRIKLDENLSTHLRIVLEELGHDVCTAASEGLLGKSDVEVAQASQVEGRVVFTLDIGFADLRKFPPGRHPGVFLFRPRTLGYRAVSQFVADFMATTSLEELSGCVVVIEVDRIRVRRPPSDEFSVE